jgi:hypothetical protein
VKAIVAIEAGMWRFAMSSSWAAATPVNKAWGIGKVPLVYAPQVSDRRNWLL